MKPYREQISAIKDIIDYTFDPDETNEPDLEALRDAASTIIAVERDEKLFLAAGDLLRALEEAQAGLGYYMMEAGIDLNNPPKGGTWELIQNAIKKARFG